MLPSRYLIISPGMDFSSLKGSLIIGFWDGELTWSRLIRRVELGSMRVMGERYVRAERERLT